MHLTHEQVSLLQAQRVEQRDATLAGHLREHHPHLVGDLSDAELARRVRIGVRRAGRFGIDWDSSVAAYLIIMLRAAPNFDEHRTMRTILGHPGLAPNLRVAALVRLATEEDWREVVARRDDRVWGEGAPG